MKDIFPRSGYELAAKILESHPDDAVETTLKFSGNGEECDWLELKAGMTLLQKDKDHGETEELLHWKYARHGFDVVADRDFFGELDIVMHYMPKARKMIDTLRAGWADTTIPVEGILPLTIVETDN